ncbi:anaerobic ribonucleoside-triphosphate reductase activating protein [Pseudoalteromonas fenneropenaei]|uniref:Anaerobic ribonucleoside-triphosphate reductase activating protein n=1 Tax=Pseudoalteromonas fenneropenaei TaxID=1737459 RepID=A0ABV7CJX4_9GAMM
MFNVLEPQVCFQEVPNEIALGFVCTGCQLGCKGCHSPQSWNANLGTPLTQTVFAGWLRRYEGLITCVVFFGGEWQEHRLLPLLRYAQSQGLKTCLYTGLDYVSEQLKNELTYLKTGRYIQSLGGLGQHSTNQKFIDVASGQLLNSYFIKG